MKQIGFTPIMVISGVLILGVTGFFACRNLLSTISWTPLINTLLSASSPASSSSPNQVQATPGYTIKILGKAVTSTISNKSDGIRVKVSVPVEINNISVKPFITDFSFISCKVLDTQGNMYPVQEGIMNVFKDTKFKQAILPDKSLTTNIETQTFPGTLPKCSYDSGGKNVCQTIAFSRIESCQATISTDGTSNTDLGQGIRYPLDIIFP